MASRNTPEYKALSRNRTELEKRLSHCLKEVAGALRDRDVLTSEQYTVIDSGNSCGTLLDIILLSVEVDPEEAFTEFIDVLKQYGNKYTKKFIADTIEDDRKRFGGKADSNSEVSVPSGQATQPTDHTDGARPKGGSSVNDQLELYKEKMNIRDAELDQEIEQIDLPYVADCVDSIGLYPDALKLAGHEKTDVLGKIPLSGTRVGMSECLGKWKSHNTYNATFRALLKVMFSLNNAEDAQRVLEYIRNKRPATLPTVRTRGEERMLASGDDDDIDDSLPDSLLLKHKNIMENHRESLCSGMNAPKVIYQLRKQGVFTLYDQQIILSKPADYDKNGDILDRLYRCGPQAFHELVRCLKTIDVKHTQLAYTLQPVKYRVLWFVSSPTLAAAVVHTLEKYNKVLFPEFPSKVAPGSKYIVRRAVIFHQIIAIDDLNGEDDGSDQYESVEDVEVCLVFPVQEKDCLMRDAMLAAFEECPQAHVAVMSGVCDGVRGVVSEGDIIIATSLSSDHKLDPALIHTAEQTIEKILTPPQSNWLKDLHSKYGLHIRKPFLGCIASPLSTLEAEHPKLECADSSSCLAHDTDTCGFYQLCQTKLAEGTPYFACKGVSGDTLSCAVASSCVAMEICRELVERVRKAS